MLQQCSAHAIQLEHVAVLARACLYLQDGAASILLHNALRTTCGLWSVWLYALSVAINCVADTGPAR